VNVVDLFAGPGGWEEGARMTGYTGEILGIEHCEAACRTALAAGHERLQADVAVVNPAGFAGADGLIASPPCQSFSQAGLRTGINDARGELVWQPLRWAREIQPRWVACEQVPEVLPIWRLVAAHLRELDYSTWAGVLNAADYGVPQTRQRAVLVARRDGVPAVPPAPTHAEADEPGLFGDALLPWVSIREATGRSTGCQRHTYGAGMIQRYGERPARLPHQPSLTITAGSQGSGTRLEWVDSDGNAERLTVEDAMALQGFRADYPVHGNKQKRYEQVGNAIPPVLAAAVLRHFLAASEARCAA
jgi:DNA (cytosine-5)-methyltransferase 1